MRWVIAFGGGFLAVLLALLLLVTGGAEEEAAASACGPTPAGSAVFAGDGGGLDAWMAKSVPGSPMIGTGAAMVAAGTRYGIDPRAIAAIARLENVLGTVPALSALKRNSWGLGGPIESNMSFPSWEAGIEFTARLLRESYVDEGRATLGAIGDKWAPVGAANDPSGLNSGWGDKVGVYYAELGGQADGPITLAAGAAPTPGAAPALPVSGGAGPALLFPTSPSGPITQTPADHAERALGNWQSDNAIDIAVPRGTAVLAVGAGTVTRLGGSPPAESSSVIGGYSVTLTLADGNRVFSTHLLSVDVALGQEVQAGEVIGRSGFANRADHLHIGIERGDPLAIWGGGAAGAVAAGGSACGGIPIGAGDLGVATRVEAPRSFSMLPTWAMAGGRSPQEIDARLLPAALWLIQTYGVRVTAARETGHVSHGDGTALDLVPAEGTDQAAWEASAERLAVDLGWSDPCGASGVRPACALRPWVRFVGYNGYPNHGDPAHVGAHAHLHVSWDNSRDWVVALTSGRLTPPNGWVMTFPTPGAEPAGGVLPATAIAGDDTKPATLPHSAAAFRRGARGAVRAAGRAQARL